MVSLAAERADARAKIRGAASKPRIALRRSDPSKAVPGLSAEYKPPLRARLHWYRLSAAEFALLTAMCEHCSDGSTIWAAIPRLAAYSKLSERNVQYVIRGLCNRGILSQLAPGNSWKKRRPAVYRVNESALEDDPKMRPYGTGQRQLPGIFHNPVDDAATGAKVAPQPVQNPYLTGAMVAPDSRSKANSRSIGIQHGEAALNSLPAWLSFKEQLRAEISVEEWDLWVRPMFLLKAMPASADQKHLLAAIPANGRIQSAATNRLAMMRELLAPVGLNISLTPYPDEWQIEEAKQRYGVDVAPKPWTRNS